MGQCGQGRHQGVGHGHERSQLLGAEALVTADELVAGRGDLGQDGESRHGWAWYADAARAANPGESRNDRKPE